MLFYRYLNFWCFLSLLGIRLSRVNCINWNITLLKVLLYKGHLAEVLSSKIFKACISIKYDDLEMFGEIL